MNNGTEPQISLLDEADHDGFKMLSGAYEGQSSLFPAEELVAPEVITKMRKGIAALHSMPASAEQNHTLNSRRLMDACAALVQIEIRRWPKARVEQMRELEASPMFRVSKSELSRLAGIKGKNYQRIEEVLEKLHDMKIRWNILGEDSNVEWKMTSRFLSVYGQGAGRFEGMVCFAIDPRVLELILEPRLWVTLSLENVAHRLKTESSYMLYQHAWRFIATASRKTAAFPVSTWIEFMLGHSRHVRVDPKTGEKEVVDYADFKRRHLEPSITRINAVEALSHSLKLKEIKRGRKVLRLQFEFVPKSQQSLNLPLNWPHEIVQGLFKLGHTEAEIADLSQGFTLDEVGETFKRYRDAEERRSKRGDPILAPKAFFHGILSNVANRPDLDDAAIDEIEKQARVAEAQARAADQQQRATVDFSNHQVKRIMAQLQAWPEARKLELLNAFGQSDDFSKARLAVLVAKGWDKAGYAAWAVLRGWLAKHRTDVMDELLPNPEDKTLEAWLLWRLNTPNVDTAL